MVFDLKPVFSDKGEIQVDYTVDIPDISISGVHVTGVIKSRATVARCDLLCSFDKTAPCDRCGAVTTKHFDVPVRHTFVTALHDPDHDDVDEFVVVPDLKADIDEISREDIILAMPYKFLCSEDCTGIALN